MLRFALDFDILFIIEVEQVKFASLKYKLMYITPQFKFRRLINFDF